MGGFRAKDADRERYVEVIQTAYVDGQLGDQDRELRISRALTAETLDELDLLTRDLQNQPAPLVVRKPAPRVAEQAPVDAPAKPVPWPVPPKSGSLAKVTWFIVVGVFGLSVVAMSSASQQEVDPLFPDPDFSTIDIDEYVATAPEPSFRMNARDVRAMVAAYEEQFGTRDAYQLDLHPRRVVAQVPVAGARPRLERWTWDGEWRRDAPATAVRGSRERVDVGSLGARRLVKNIGTARGAVGVEGGRFDRAVLVSRDGATVLEIHVRNEFNETGHLTTTPAGDIVGRDPFDG